ncbi:MAG: aminotransferase class IV [Candidatus Omnitrophota bacterium]
MPLKKYFNADLRKCNADTRRLTDYVLCDNLRYLPQADNCDHLRLGNGAFESMRAYNGKIFKLNEHIGRLAESCKALGMERPVQIEEIKRRILRDLSKSKLKNAYIRCAVTPAGINVIVKEIHRYPQELYTNGVTVICVPTRKNSSGARIKSQNFLSGVLARIEGGDAFECLMLNIEGYVAEGTVSNFFIVKCKTLFTVPPYIGILDGITRRSVIALAGKLGIETKETPLSRYDIYTADEVFLTNTSIEIMPVVNVDARVIGDGRVGELTKKLSSAFAKLTKGGAQ